METDDMELENQLREALTTAAEPVHGEGVQVDVVRQAVARRRRTRMGVRFSLVATAAAAMIALVLLTRPDDDRVDTAGDSDRTTTSTTDTSTPPEPDREDPPGTSSSTTTLDPGATSTSSSTTSSTTPSTSSTSSTTASQPRLPEFPPEFTGLTQGGRAWALYLAVVPPGQYDAPELAAANSAAAEAGYGGAGPSDLGCDQGAPEALGRDSSSVTAPVYFETEAQANQAQAAFAARGDQVVGIVNVTTYCLD